MTAGQEAGRRPALFSALCLTGALAAAAGLRSAIGGAAAVQSPGAGLAFAACLAVAAAAAGTTLTVNRRDLVTGLCAAAVICAPVALQRIAEHAPLHGTNGFAAWAPIVAAVACAEEFFLRGAFFDAITALAGPATAVVAAAVAFALLHVPLYGWPAMPLDLAVGLVLGLARLVSGSATGPALAHTAADFAGWFLR
jgi:membrane protease YdiL (CAAX protease family)